MQLPNRFSQLFRVRVRPFWDLHQIDQHQRLIVVFALATAALNVAAGAVAGVASRRVIG
jgi:hypothetical protein